MRELECWSSYEELQRSHPELFENPKSDGIRILFEKSEIEESLNFRRTVAMEKGLTENAERLGVVFEDEYLVILRDPVFFPRTGFRSYLRIIEKPLGIVAVVVFPVFEGKLVLLHHFRHATRRWSLEIPRGFGNSGDWEKDAAEELRDETGGIARRLVNVGQITANTGLFATMANCVYAELESIDKRRVSRDEQDPGIGKVELFDSERFRESISRGDVFDSYTLSAACLVAANGIDSRWTS